jgi:hypothetical protein
MMTLLNNSMDDMSLLYESVLINEMTQDVVNYLGSNKDQLPFSKMFGDKIRLVVPIGGDITAREILEDLTSLKDYSGIDIGAGEVFRKIKLDPKYGQGSEKEQKMSIGKAVNSLKIDPEKKKKYLDWLAKYKDNLDAALSDISDYVIILSRAPIDIVRMSDHANITSCHSRGSSYFKCAVQEAVTGGAVAYVVDRDMLDYHLKDSVDSLQNDDFFHDADREVRGIRPVARLRVRRVESDDGTMDLGVPDDRIYGNSSIPGFGKYLNEFLKKYQTEEIKNFMDSKGSRWTYRGGSYLDTNIATLVNDFVGDDIVNNINHNFDDSSGESDWATNGWGDELEDIKSRYNNQMTYCSIDYYIEADDEHPYIMPSGSCTIDISQFDLPDDANLNIDDHDYITSKGLNGDYDDEYVWSYVIKYLRDKIKSVGIDIGSLQIDNKYIEIQFYNEDFMNNPQSFDDDYAWSVEQFDNIIENMLEDPDELRHVLEESELINAIDYSNSEYSRYADYMENDENYANISIFGTRNDISVIFDENIFRVSPIGELPRTPRIQFFNWPELFQKFIYNFTKEHFHPKVNIDVNNPTFKNFFESYTNPISDIDFTILPFQLNVSHYTQSSPKHTFTNEKIKLKPSGITNTYFEFFDFLDDIYPHLNNFFKMAVMIYISKNDPEMFDYYKHNNLPQLKKLYGKYID